jgi:hypothetical protein
METKGLLCTVFRGNRAHNKEKLDGLLAASGKLS